MLRSLRRHTPVVLTAVIVATLMQVGPPVVAAAYDAVNADKVDGRHAVGAGATPAKRAGKLVATNAQGRLPDSIIAKAPDAAKLGGVAPDGYLRNQPDGVTGDSVLAGSIQRDDLQYRALLPRAFGLVNFNGTVEANYPSEDLTSDNITVPESPAGVFCIHGLGFSPRTVSVSSAVLFSGPVTAGSAIGQHAGCEGVEGTQVTVWTYAVPNGSVYNGSFNIQLWS
jgi:hypothetical protein